MDPKFQTSFIPKSPVTSQQKSSSISIPSINIFATISTVMFFLTIILLGGVFGYEYYLNQQIASIDREIEAANQSYQLQDAKNIIAANSRIIAIKNLIDKHVVTSELFNLLQTITMKKISFGSFEFTSKDNEYSVKMTAEAQTYNALAQQLSAFSESGSIKNPQFSGFELSDNGNIKTNFTATLNPKIVSYKSYIDSLSGAQ